MQRRDQRRQLGFFHVLQFIDENHQRGVCGLRRGADRLQQRLQVMLQIAIVGQARLWIEVQADFDILIFDLQRFRKTRQGAQSPLREIFRLLVSAQPQQSLAQLRRK